MARLGVDFGTTNTVAVVHDRGVFSVVLHRAETGAGTIVQDVYPSSILIEEGQRWFGLEADRRFGQHGSSPGSFFLPSIKRQLRNYAQGVTLSMDAFSGRFEIAGLLRSFLESVAASIRASGTVSRDEPLEAVITWPANANGAQRYITRQCFRDAGFDVLATLSEPTASAIELADCLTGGRGGRERREPSAVAVFDLGGGTFDASVVWIDGDDFQVLASAGIEDLGGDDLDRALLEMFLDKLKLSPEAVIPLTRHALLRQARSQKETISNGVVKTLFLNPMDFGIQGFPVSIPVKPYYERLRPMLKRAVDTLASVVARAAEREPRINVDESLTIYLVGGASKLPLVSQMVAEAFRRCKVILTDKPFTSVAMGAAICAMDRVRYRDIFARHFGLLRLRATSAGRKCSTWCFRPAHPFPARANHRWSERPGIIRTTTSAICATWNVRTSAPTACRTVRCGRGRTCCFRTIRPFLWYRGRHRARSSAPSSLPARRYVRSIAATATA